MILPKEICEKIYFYNIQIHVLKFKNIHDELINNEQYLNLTNNIFDSNLDFCHAIRLPKLIST